MAAARRRKPPATGTRKSLQDVLADTLLAHRGHLLMDSRFHCVCGWVSNTPNDHTPGAVTGSIRQGAIHQALQAEQALADNAALEEETPTDEV